MEHGITRGAKEGDQSKGLHAAEISRAQNSQHGLSKGFHTTCPRPASVPLLRAFWSLLDSVWSFLKGSCGVLGVTGV